MTAAREILTFFAVTGGLGIGCGIGIASAFYRFKIERLKRKILMLQTFPSLARTETFFPVRPFFLPKNRRRF